MNERKENKIKMKKTKTQKGITLIALIITIVVLLILAAVAISSITNDNILGYAQNAAKDYNQAVANEQGMLDYYEAYLGGTLGKWIQNGTTVSKTTEGKTIKLEVGTTVTGYDAGVDTYTGGWAILGAENGKILLVSTTNVQSSVPLGGNIGSDAGEEYVAGYSNGAAKLDEICAPYLNSTLADEARSIKVEDINRVTGYNPAATGDGNPYGNGEVYQYGNEVTYTLTSDGKVAYSSAVKSADTSSYTSFTLPNGTALTAEMPEGIKVKSNYYYYYPNTLTTSSSGTTNGIAADSAAYTALFSNTNYGSGSYWLASPNELARTGYANFGLRAVLEGRVDGGGLWYADIGAHGTSNFGARAVVSLKSDVNIDASGKIS